MLPTATRAVRSILMLSGASDELIPLVGGVSGVADALTGERLSFLSVLSSVEAYARAKEGDSAVSSSTLTVGGAVLTYHTSLDGAVQVHCSELWVGCSSAIRPSFGAFLLFEPLLLLQLSWRAVRDTTGYSLTAGC